MKKILLTLLAVVAILSVYAQNFEFGKVSLVDNDFDRKKTDSNANAVVLYEFGTARMQLDDNTGYLNIFFRLPYQNQKL